MIEPIFNNPELTAILAAVILFVLRYQRGVGWTEYRTIHSLKRGLLPLIDKHTMIFAVSRKGGRDDGEYISTVDKPLRATFTALRKDGFSPHLINSIKQRPHPNYDGPQYSAAHLVKTHSDGYQSEIYLFDMGGQTDVYAHVERSVTDPQAHLNDTDQQDGDVRNVLPEWITAS